MYISTPMIMRLSQNPMVQSTCVRQTNCDALILIAFITGNSSLEPLIEGLCAQIHVILR